MKAETLYNPVKLAQNHNNSSHTLWRYTDKCSIWGTGVGPSSPFTRPRVLDGPTWGEKDCASRLTTLAMDNEIWPCGVLAEDPGSCPRNGRHCNGKTRTYYSTDEDKSTEKNENKSKGGIKAKNKGGIKAKNKGGIKAQRLQCVAIIKGER